MRVGIFLVHKLKQKHFVARAQNNQGDGINVHEVGKEQSGIGTSSQCMLVRIVRLTTEMQVFEQND